MMAGDRILRPGWNCWKIARADRLAFLVDAAAYFEAFARSAEKARQSILITAWDIDGRVRLRRDHPGESFRRLLLRLLREKPGLNVHILNWDFVWLYASDRELLPWFDRLWRVHPRLHFQWDGAHPPLACHHQKVVVLDDRLAFSGGLDFADERWDTPDHYPTDRRRQPLHRDHYKPFHDAMVMMEGPVAHLLGNLVRQRWKRALPHGYAGNGLPHVPSTGPAGGRFDLWPDGVRPELRGVDVAIARTEPALDGRPRVREVERLFEDTIAAARRTLYIENQYFTSTRVSAAVARRLREPDPPEIIIVMPRGCTGRIEEFSLGIARWRHIRRVKREDRRDRLHFYYPEIRGLPPDDYIKVHSKIMIADDRFVRVGSANLCNRSMDLDTECDIAVETVDGTAVSAAIRRFRARLLAEHLACPADQIEEVFGETGSLAETIRRCSRPHRRLVPFEGEVSAYLDRIMPRKVARPLRRRL